MSMGDGKLKGSNRTSSEARWVIGPMQRALAALVLVLVLGAIFNADGAFFKGSVEMTGDAEAAKPTSPGAPQSHQGPARKGADT